MSTELGLRAMMGCLLVALCCTVAAAKDYYVDVQSLGGPADDAGPGSLEQPWRTLSRAVGDAQPRPEAGDVIWVREGVYKEQVTLETGGAAGQPLNIKAFAEERPIVDGEGTRRYGVLLSDEGAADHVLIQGLTLRNFHPEGVGLSVSGRTGVKIHGVEVSGARMGVWISRSSSCELTASHIHHCDNGNVWVDTGCADIVLADNHIHHNAKGHGLSVYAPGNAVHGHGKLTSVTLHEPGVARFTAEGLDLRGLRRGTLRGQDAKGGVANPSLALLFEGGDPRPDGKPLPGGTVRLPDGRDWFVLRSNPDWGGKPYSPDGTSGLLEVGQATIETLVRADYIYLAYVFSPDVANRDIRILRNDIHDSAIQGVWVQRANGVLVRDNRTHHNGASGIQIESLCRRVWIDGNVSYANGVVHNHETGIWLDETIHAVVQNNTVYENQKGMGVTQCEWVLMRRNLIHNNQAQHVTKNVKGCRGNAGGFWYSGGRHHHLGAPPGARHNAFVHNTVYANGTQISSWGGIQHGLPGYPRIGRNRLLNNLVQGNLGAHPVYAGSVAAVLDGNLYGGPAPFRALWRTGEENAVYSLSDPQGWRDYVAATKQDGHSVFGTAVFVAPHSIDFRLVNDSPGIDGGAPLTRTTGAGSGTEVLLADVDCFSAGLDMCGGEVVIPGDEIMVGSARARVLAVDREASVLTVDREIAWEEGEPVTYTYHGAGPDVGALEAD